LDWVHDTIVVDFKTPKCMMKVMLLTDPGKGVYNAVAGDFTMVKR
jgi:hypothetical protein